jgi:plastocyanin
MVIHADNQGAPGAILGFAPVPAGVSKDLEVEIGTEGVTATIYAMLHVDAGSQGEFEFPGGADVPAKNDEDAIIVSPFSLTGFAAGEGSVTSIGIRDNQFSPGELTITAGTTVSWQHEGSFPHTVTADDGQFDSGNLEGGDSYSFTFDEPGEYPYHCQYHGNPGGAGMSGLIIVNAR